MDFTQLLMDAIVRELIAPRVDPYGNQITSPVQSSVQKWAEAHKEDIFRAVSDKLDVKKIAEVVSQNIMTLMAGVDGRYSSYDRSAYIKELNGEITKKLAERIANDMDLKNPVS